MNLNSNSQKVVSEQQFIKAVTPEVESKQVQLFGFSAVNLKAFGELPEIEKRCLSSSQRFQINVRPVLYVFVTK